MCGKSGIISVMWRRTNWVFVMTQQDHDTWNPLSIHETSILLKDFHGQWWIAGGYAIELFVGRPIRSHGDMDILIKRETQTEIQDYLSSRSWELYRATYPGLQKWEKAEFLTGRYRDIWCRPDSRSPWRLQIMLLDTEGNEWVFKRDPNIRGKLTSMFRTSDAGLNYLSPEIQLLYKAKESTLDKDQIDFELSVPLLDNQSRKWLLDQLTTRFPKGHKWIDSLDRLS